MPSMIAKSVNMIWIGCSIMPEPEQQRVDDAFVADHLLIAKVRISRLVQNGMVIRNSQMSRLRSGRVAMK